MSQKRNPKGGRPAKNFEPRYGQKARKKVGGPSPKHRGYRPAENDAAPKRRYTDEQRPGRDDVRATSRHGQSADRSAYDRSASNTRRYGNDDNRRNQFSHDNRSRNNDRFTPRDDRGRYSRDDRSERGGYGRDDRGGYARNDRNGSPRNDRGGYSHSDRGGYGRNADGRGYNRDDRGGYSRDHREGYRGGDNRRNDNRDFRRDDRSFGGANRGYDRDERRDNDNRDRRDFTRRDDRGGRNFDRRDDRGSRPFNPRDDRAGRNFDRRDDRGSRDFSRRDDAGARDFGRRNERGDGRGFSRDDRAGSHHNDRARQRSAGRGYAPEDRHSDRGFSRNERPRNDDRPRRDDRPARDDRRARDDRPAGDDRFGRTDGARRNDGPIREARPASSGAPSAVDVVHERLEAQTVVAEEVADVTFADLGMGSNITEVLANMGAEKPFPIQAASIPAVLQGRDVLGRGRTGSGKTIAFGAPLVESILTSQKGKKREYGRAPRAIILAPTRELALQIDRTVQPIARSVGLFTTQIYGGVPQARQVGALKKGVDIVIGTPGRIEDLINQGKLDLSEIRIAVLDEADHMCELGFVEPVQRILRHTGTDLPRGERSQKLLFSATLDREVASLVNEFLVDPAVFEVAGEDQESGTIDHRVLVVEHRDKADILSSLVDRHGKTLVFSRTRAYAEMLTEQFEDAGISAVALHGDLNQAKRTRNLHKVTSGKAQVLVATDVAARGIHVDDIDLVVQADAPDEYKTYLHRAGRTGRAGRAGTVVTLITRPRRRRLGELLSRAEIEAPFVEARPGDDIIDELAGRTPTLAELTA